MNDCVSVCHGSWCFMTLESRLIPKMSPVFDFPKLPGSHYLPTRLVQPPPDTEAVACGKTEGSTPLLRTAQVLREPRSRVDVSHLRTPQAKSPLSPPNAVEDPLHETSIAAGCHLGAPVVGARQDRLDALLGRPALGHVARALLL